MTTKRKRTWGGKRVPGPGKRLGPKPKPLEERRVLISARILPETYRWIGMEAERRGVKASALIASVLDQESKTKG